MQARWRQAGVHSAAGRQENTATPSVREQRGIQERSALSRRHRGTHLAGAVPRPRHEALSRRRTRTLRIVGQRHGCARQQPHGDRGTTDGSVASQTKSCLTDTQARFRQIRTAAGSTCLELKKFAKQHRAQARKSPVRGLPMPASTGILCPIPTQEITWIAAINPGVSRQKLD